MASSIEYSFKAKIAPRGYHVFKETTWNNVKEGNSVRADLEINKLSKNVYPYACAILAKNTFFTPGKRWDISREKFLVMFIILSRQKMVLQMVQLYQLNIVHRLISSGGLEMPLLLKFSCP